MNGESGVLSNQLHPTETWFENAPQSTSGDREKGERMMAANPRLKALPKPHEQVFIDTVRKIREKRLTTQEDLPDLPKALSEKAAALFTAMTDFGETGFWQAYDALAEDAPQLRVWKEVIVTVAPPEEKPTEESDERFLTSQSGKLVLRLSTIDDIYALPDAFPLIAGVLEAGSVSMLYGVSGTGKTFTGLDLALSISHGIPWQGRAVQQGTTWYINTEGKRGLKKRLQAWYKEHETLEPPLDAFKIIPWPLDLRVYTQELIETINEQEAPPTLIVVDNFSMCTPGIDQNKQEQVAPVLHLMNTIAADYNCHLLIIHHTNKTGDVNGTMAFRNHVDTMIELVKEDTADRESPILFRCMKARDTEPFRDIRTELKPVLLSINPETREMVTSCVVIPAEVPVKEPHDGLKDVEQNILDILGDRFLAYTEWQNESMKDLSISSATFSRARTVLENKGLVGKMKVAEKRFDVYRQIQRERSAWNE
jgi:AAA domain